MSSITIFLSEKKKNIVVDYLFEMDKIKHKGLIDFLKNKKEVTAASVEEAARIYDSVPSSAYNEFVEAVQDLGNAAFNIKVKNERDMKDCSLIADGYAFQWSKLSGI